jgi:hypothetical protein
MELKHSKKRAGATILGLVALLSMTAVAQETRSEVVSRALGFSRRTPKAMAFETMPRYGWVLGWLPLQHHSLAGGRSELWL